MFFELVRIYYMEKRNKEKKISYGQFWHGLWRLTRPIRGGLFRILIFSVFITILGTLKPYALKLVIDRLTNFSPSDWPWIILFVASFWVADLVRTGLQYFNQRILLKILVELEYYLPLMAHQKLLHLNLGYHESENTGNKIVRIEKGVYKISDMTGNLFSEVAPTLIQLVITAIALTWIEYRFALCFLFFAIPFIVSTYVFNKKLYPIRKARFALYEKASGKMAQAIMNINAVQSFSQEEREANDYRKIKQEVKDKEDREWRTVARINFGRNSLVDIGRAVVFLLGAYFVFRGEVTIGSLVFVMSLSESAYASLYRLSRFYDSIEEGREGVRRLQELIEKEEDIKSPENGVKLKKIIGEVKFKNVSFNYRNESEAVIRKINLKIPSGAVTALVGPSGSGKTTLARLIYRHYDPTSGQILVDDHDLRTLDLHAYRRLLAIVPQEVEIFDLSLRDNIAYAHPRASFKEIKAAAKMANAEEFILKLDKQYDTLVGERGVKLSGGQRQRIGIARAILADPQILIFDEATSNLDSYSEKLIQEAIERVQHGRTMIVIAHRLSTISKADKIVVMENGRIIEEGGHLELSHQGGLYAKLLHLQNTGDIIGEDK